MVVLFCNKCKLSYVKFVLLEKINKEKLNSDKDTLGSLKTTAVLLTKTFEELQRLCISSDLRAVWLVAEKKILFYIQVDCLTSQHRHILVCTIEIKIPV